MNVEKINNVKLPIYEIEKKGNATKRLMGYATQRSKLGKKNKDRK